MKSGERVSNKDNFICQFVLTKGLQGCKSAGGYAFLATGKTIPAIHNNSLADAVHPQYLSLYGLSQVNQRQKNLQLRQISNALQLNGDGCGQAGNTQSCSTRLVLGEVARVYPVIGFKVTVHISEEDSHIHQILPLGTSCFQYGSDIAKNAVTLLFEIKSNEIAGSAEG
jgi:hypothetical protein